MIASKSRTNDLRFEKSELLSFWIVRSVLGDQDFSSACL